MSWKDHLTEENLFYVVSPGAMETYRNSIESHLAKVEKTGSCIQEEVETSMYDAAADFVSQGGAYEEDEGETSTYYLPGGFEGNTPSKFGQKKRKNLTKSNDARAYDLGTNSPIMQCMENKVGTQQSVLMGKQPANSLNVGSIPTKRIRTASRQRFLYPFSGGTSGGVQGPNKTDASSGDTNSFQDDQSTMHGGFQIRNSLEVESVGDLEKQLPFDSTEVSKPKKKKKAKHLGSTYEHRWQFDNNFGQRDHSKRRMDSHQLESNGRSGLFGQHIMKKPKMTKQSLDNSFDNLTPMTGTTPSPVASQMSNMSNPNKLIKILGGRDRGRKTKSSKMPTGQPGSGGPWSLFEDQALVVLVHDMGPHWELVSDAINSTLQFKCICRKPKECKERHKILMDKTAGDGADSAEDSGSSQPYPSTLPGIPKGSARQLFQRLQGPMEEDMIKSHFGKIITISQKQHYHRIKNDNQDLKPIQPHHSHTIALSQVCPNYLNGGPPLTPLDLCDTTTSSPDVLSLGYQGSHTSVLTIPNQGTVASVVPISGANSSLQGSSNIVLGNNFPSPSGPLNAPVRDGRYGVPRSASLAIDEQQRMQQYNQMLSGRNVQQPGLSVSGALPGTDRGVRMLPGGNSMGVMCGMNRNMPMARPSFQGIGPSSILNSGGMLSSSMAVMPSPVNMHSGVGSGQGNSMLRPRDALNMMRPGQNPEHQRQMMVPELQMQVAQGNSQGVPPFVGLSSAFSNQTSPPAQTYPLHPQQAHVLSNSHHPHLQGPNHAASTQHQAYAMRIAKERQMQQRLQLQQQHQQQFATSNALMPHVQSQSQLPMSSSMQNSSQVQPQRRTGMPRFKAREVVTEAIQRKGLYRGAKNNEMRLGICSRSNDVVEPLIKPQWYVNCNSMAKQALDAVFDDKNRKMEIIPKQYAAEWKRWLENIRDWCFSRQLWWGHRIPAWYVTLEDDELKELGAYNDHWVVARNEEEAQTEANRIFPGKKLQMSQDPDVLDTWFSSGLFPLSVLGWPDDTNDLKAFYPTSVLETEHDILFFWVACMVMLGIKLGGDVPFTKESETHI